MINNKTVLAITLARGGSKGIPKKNITLINNKPLLLYTNDEVVKSKYIDDYVVGTDDLGIKNICLDNNIKVIDREKVSDTQTTAEGLLDVLSKLKRYDYVIEVMCTNPLKKAFDIDKVIELLDKNNPSSVVSVCRVYDYHPKRLKYIKEGKLIGFDKDENPDKPGYRRQDLEPIAYIRNGSIYGMTYEQITNKKMRLDNDNIIPYIMDQSRTINIDEPIDLLVAKQLLNEDN
jgi:CMP-N-acetylneuraminic acid synthetase